MSRGVGGLSHPHYTHFIGDVTSDDYRRLLREQSAELFQAVIVDSIDHLERHAARTFTDDVRTGDGLFSVTNPALKRCLPGRRDGSGRGAASRARTSLDPPVRGVTWEQPTRLL